MIIVEGDIMSEIVINEFQKLVKGYMSLLPEQFEIIFESFEGAFDLDSVYKDKKAIFRYNTDGWKENPRWYAKMAVLLFHVDYFKLNRSAIISKKMNLCLQGIMFLIP